MFPLVTRYNCLQQFRYAISPSRAAAHIECTAYIDRRKTDIENPKRIYIDGPVAKHKFCNRSFRVFSISKGIEDIHSVQGDHNDQQDDQNPADGNDGVQLL